MSYGVAVGKGSVAEISKYLEDELVGLHTTMVYKNESKIEDSDVILHIFERYYHRNKERAALTVLISGKDDDVRVEAVAAGGGGGLMFRINFGAHDDFTFRVGELLRARDFEIISSSSNK
jgi:AcrR family transcriptional regulator